MMKIPNNFKMNKTNRDDGEYDQMFHDEYDQALICTALYSVRIKIPYFFSKLCCNESTQVQILFSIYSFDSINKVPKITIMNKQYQ